MGLYLSRYLSWYLGEPKASLQSSAPKSSPLRPTPQRPALRTVQASREDTGTRTRRTLVAQARRGSPCRQSSSERSLTAKLSYAYLNQVKWELLAAGDPRLQGLVRVQVNPTVRPESLCQCPQSEGHPDPCAKETVLQALRQCKKGKRKFDGPLWFEMLDPKTRALNQEPKPSAFQPVSRNGVTQSFVPRPGPLSRSCAQGNPALRRGR